ncbi:hypothetical protein GCM10023166_05770 [Paeniglutamicibacter cryotolerans]
MRLTPALAPALIILALVSSLGLGMAPTTAATGVGNAPTARAATAAMSSATAAGKPLPRDPRLPNVMVNKKHPLQPLKFVPRLRAVPGSGASLQPEAALAFNKMAAAAKKDGARIRLVSGYRSYSTQQALFASYARRDGAKAASRFSARPGYSEHQTGWGMDVGTASGSCRVAKCFANTTEGRWMRKHAATYGFILRYPAGMEAVTGYIYEPWHFRYLGPRLAAAYTASGATTLEQYDGLVPGPPAQWGVRKTTAPVRMYATAGTSAKLLAIIPTGTELYYSANRGSWLKVQHQGRTGWIQTGNSRKATPAAKTTTLALNLYSLPAITGTRLASLPRGTVVRPTGRRSGTWYQVAYAKKTGWLSGRFLK